MAQQPLTSRIICVSGASAGIGKAIAEVFAEQGYSLIIGARRLARLEAMREALLKRGAASVLPLALDVTSDESVTAFAKQALDFARGRVDILVNNAGLAVGVDPLAKGRIGDWETMINTNILGVLRLTRGFLPAMIEANHGHVINMGSIAGHQTYMGGNVYAATKHALRALTQSLRLELNGTAIRVSTVDPGMVQTEFSLVRLKDEQKAKDVYRGMTPLTARDIAECVAFAASRPPHVNIDEIIVMPTDQASVYKTHRRD